MIRLLLIRHGNTFEEGQMPLQIGSKTDLPLTAYGLLQAERAALYLKRENIVPSAVFSGSLKRQTEMAKKISNSFILTPALTEIDYGLWEGLSGEEIRSRFPSEYADWNEKGIWPKGIFGSELQRHKQLIAGWLEFLCAKYSSGSTIVGITSNGVIRLFHPGSAEKVKTGHLCELLVSPDSVEVQRWNYRICLNT